MGLCRGAASNVPALTPMRPSFGHPLHTPFQLQPQAQARAYRQQDAAAPRTLSQQPHHITNSSPTLPNPSPSLPVYQHHILRS